MKINLLFIFLVVSICFCSCGKYITETGKASYYSDSYQGKKTANGEIYKTNDYTAAHKKLPFGTKVKITNLKNGKTVTVRVNDRGPFVAGRIIDLSRIAAQDISMIADGVVNVEIKYKRKKKA